MVSSCGRGGFTAICLLLAGASEVEGQLAGTPAAILTEVRVRPVEIEPEGMKTTRMGEVGDLLFAGDRVKGRAVVTECNGSASRQWYPTPSAAYIGGKGVEGSTDSDPVAACRVPEPAPSADQAHIDELKAQQYEDQLARSGAITTDAAASALTGLGNDDSKDGMSVLRRAQALEDRDQLTAAILAYGQLKSIWDKAAWVRPKIFRLRIALAKKLLGSPAISRRGHVTALVIGVSDYLRQDPNYHPLKYAHLDAESFAAYLKQIDPEGQFEPLINVTATRSEIHDRLSLIGLRGGDRSAAVVFVSAHGFQDGVRSYIAPYDADFQVGIDTGVPVTEILSAVSGFEQSYVFVDACRTPVSTGRNDVNATLDQYGHQMYAQVGIPPPSGQMFLVSSSKPGMPSDEGPQFRDERGPLAQPGHGAFTYHLLKLLYLDPGTQSRSVSRGELESDLQVAMRGLRQTPETGGNLNQIMKLDPLKRVPFQPNTPPTSLLDWFRAPIRLAAYAPDQQPEFTPEVAGRLRAALGRGTITTQVARQAVAAYFRLSPANQMLTRSAIRIALEDEGERLLLDYLHGYEVEPPQADFADAHEYYTLAEQLAPDSPLLRARAAFNSGRAMLFDLADPAKRRQHDTIYTAALTQLFDAYREDPGPYVLNALGIAYMEQGDWDKAIPAFDDASRLAPGWLYPKHNRALSLMRSGRARAAIEEYRKAIAEMPSAFTLHFNLALAYQQINQLREADREYVETDRWLGRRTTAARAVDWARLYNAQGTLAAQRGKLGAARKLYQKAKDTAPLPETVHNLALISPPAVKEQMLEQNRGYLNSRIELAQVYKRKGRVTDAIAEYREIVKLRDDFAGAHLDLAQLYLRDSVSVAERLRLANGELAQAEKPEPGFWKVYLVRAELERLQKQDADARTDYREARRRAPDRDARREIAQSERGKWLH
jgi:tetratricopeptide (TPR) repeat protein